MHLLFLWFPGISTTSMPWTTGARPSVGCKCRSSSNSSSRYCHVSCFNQNIYALSPADTSSVSAERPLVMGPQTSTSLSDSNRGVTSRRERWKGEVGVFSRIKCFCAFASNQSLKMCYVCMTARKRYMNSLGLSREDNCILNFTGF